MSLPSQLRSGLSPLHLLCSLRRFSQMSCGTIESAIRSKLDLKFKPLYLNVMNESDMHSVPKGSETHFKVIIVSKQFESLSSLKRHRLINETLKEELEKYIHALSLKAVTPSEWSSNDLVIEKSPKCRGGMGL